jgi:hypothetical protein
MTRAAIAIQSLSHGLQPEYTTIDDANDAKVLWDASAFAHIVNPTGAPIDLVIRTNVTLDDDLNLPDRTITVPDGESCFTKTFAKTVYRQSDGYVYFDTTDPGLTIAVLKP